MLAQVTLDEHGLKQLTPVAGEDGSGGGGTLEDTDFPVGYVYTQFPQQSTPSELGLPGTWTEITSNYAGKFFRAEGGNAAAFGCSQHETNKWTGSSSKTQGTYQAGLPSHCHAYNQDSSAASCYHCWPYITYGSQTYCYVWPTYQTVYKAVEAMGYISGCNWSPSCCVHFPMHLVSLNSTGSEHSHVVSLTSSYSETRPINYSIRIWKRIA